MADLVLGLGQERQLRWSPGARETQCRSHSPPNSSELACISMNRKTSVQYRSGMASPGSTIPPEPIKASNALSDAHVRMGADYASAAPA